MQRLWQVITAGLIVTSAWGTPHPSGRGAEDSPAPPKLRLPAGVAGPVRYGVYGVELT